MSQIEMASHGNKTDLSLPDPSCHQQTTNSFGMSFYTHLVSTLKTYKLNENTNLPALVIIISVSSRWNVIQSSWFRRRAEIVLPSPSMAVLLVAEAFFLGASQRLLDLEFWSCASGFGFETWTREECVSATTASGHVSDRSVDIGISPSACLQIDFEIDSSISEKLYN